ncbi:GH10888 [Drosophila grimshawi]|uniref:GH10888 n=2 Tax=Drosophila grimshawi TaxID=7222 RepID=B4JAL4_DROGR|nr:GH10888 [Drosophila grimshawi]
MEQQINYETAIKKAQLVERNPQFQVDPMRVSMHDETDIIHLAQEIQSADKMVRNSTSQKLVVILDQIKMLQAQAIDILKESNENRMLHSVACNFNKKPGKIYHLYQKSTGQNYFSMLSPEEWNNSVEQTYKGSYRLEFDSSWTPIDKIKEHDNKLKWVEQCMDSIDSGAIAAIDFNSLTNN